MLESDVNNIQISRTLNLFSVSRLFLTVAYTTTFRRSFFFCLSCAPRIHHVSKQKYQGGGGNSIFVVFNFLFRLIILSFLIMVVVISVTTSFASTILCLTSPIEQPSLFIVEPKCTIHFVVYFYIIQYDDCSIYI